MATCPYTFVKPSERTAPTVNPDVNYRLWGITMCQGKCINCSKYTAAGKVPRETAGEAMCGGEGQEAYGNSVLSAQFCCELKTEVKKIKSIKEL